MKKGRSKVVSKGHHFHRNKLIDNPLLQSTLKHSSAPASAVKKEFRPLAEKLKDPSRYVMSADEERASVFEIISDLEKQLDSAFILKDSHEKEILELQQELKNSAEKAAMFEAKHKEMKGMLVSQEELNSELEFLENERLETLENVKSMEEKRDAMSAVTKDLQNKILALTKEVEGRDKRIEQIELELASANKTMQSLYHQVSLVEEEKEAISAKLEETGSELSATITERDRDKRELERAKESLDEIRLMLADTRARTRKHYYKTNISKAK